MTQEKLIAQLAKELSLKDSQVEKTVALLDEGNTIPFIARYRKEVTGGMDDITLRKLDDRLNYIRKMDERRSEIAKLIERNTMDFLNVVPAETLIELLEALQMEAESSRSNPDYVNLVNKLDAAASSALQKLMSLQG